MGNQKYKNGKYSKAVMKAQDSKIITMEDLEEMFYIWQSTGVMLILDDYVCKTSIIEVIKSFLHLIECEDCRITARNGVFGVINHE